MSSSSYCQGLQSCLEPSHSGEPRVLRLKLSSPKSNISRSPTRKSVPLESDCDIETNKDNNKPDMGGWSFLQSLDFASKSTKDETKINDKVYIPPSVKRSSSMLNARSLEMCTESLGSETGSDVSDSSDEMTLTSPDTNVDKHDPTVNFETSMEIPRLRTTHGVMKRSASFPPPLSSMSGSTNVQVRPRREGGRLVLEAVPMTACRTYFQAERVNGRLKLHMLRNCSPKFKNKEACIHVDENEKAHNEVEEAESTVEAEYEDIDGDDDDDDDYINDDDEEEEEEVRGEELEENNGEDGSEIGIEKLAKAMSSRCMEGGSCDGKALLNNKNWETYCVAT